MNDQINNRQVAFILFGAIVGFGVLRLSKDVAEQAGTGGWVAILIATCIAVLSTIIIIYVNYIHKEKTIYEYSELLMGKHVRALIVFVYIVHCFLTFAPIARLASEAIKQTILLKTPVWALSMSMLIVTYFTITKGLTVIARLCELYGVVIIFAVLFIHILLFTQGDWINLRPFFVAERIWIYMKASTVLIFPFLGMEVLLVMPLGKSNDKKVFRYVVGVVLLVGILYTIIAEAGILIMGVDSVIYFEDALLATIRRVEVPYLQFLRRLDGIFMITWLMAILTTIMVQAYAVIVLLSKCFEKVKFNLIALLVTIVGFVALLIPKTMEDVQKVLKITNYTGVLTAGVIPLILLIVTKVKKYDKKTG